MSEKIKKAIALLLALCLCLLALGAANGAEDGAEPDEENTVEPDGESSGGTGGGNDENQLYLHKALAALSQDPVALMEVANIRITSSAEHCVVSGFTWYDANGSVYSGEAFGMEAVRVEITVAALDGYLFAEDVVGYINNSSECTLTRDPSGATVTLAKSYVPALWAPSVIFHPKAATVEEGEYASFWVSGLYVAEYDWYLKGPNGEKVSVDDIEQYFTDAYAGENGKSSIVIYRIPAEMNGWSVVCTFIAAGRAAKVDTNAAKITVKGVQPTPTPSPEATPEPAPEPTAEPGADAEPSEETQAPEEEHVHEFAEEWSYDAQGHWHECVCGERQDEQRHLFTQTDEEGRSVCASCGYVVEAEAEATPEPVRGEDAMEGLSLLRWLLAIVAAGLVIGVVALLLQSARDSRRSKHSRRRR